MLLSCEAGQLWWFMNELPWLFESTVFLSVRPPLWWGYAGTVSTLRNIHTAAHSDVYKACCPCGGAPFHNWSEAGVSGVHASHLTPVDRTLWWCFLAPVYIHNSKPECCPSQSCMHMVLSNLSLFTSAVRVCVCWWGEVSTCWVATQG